MRTVAPTGFGQHDPAMTTYSRSHHVDVPADRVYDLVSDVSRLPRYFPQMRSATPTDGDQIHTTAVVDVGDGQGPQEVSGEAWFRTDAAARTVTWGAPGPNDYQGSMTVEESGDQASTVVLEIRTESAHPGIDGDIDATLQRLTQAVSGDS